MLFGHSQKILSWSSLVLLWFWIFGHVGRCESFSDVTDLVSVFVPTFEESDGIFVLGLVFSFLRGGIEIVYII